MRRLGVVLLLGAAGCSEPGPAVTDRSVWWAPLAAWRDGDLIQPMLSLLATKRIDAIFVGGRAERIWVPWERHAEAVDLLRACPHAPKLRIHTLLAGPRPNAFLPKRTSGDEGAVWISLAVFKPAEVPVEKLQQALQAGSIESGVVAFAGSQGEAHLFVPSSSAAAARGLLRSGTWAGLRVSD